MKDKGLEEPVHLSSLQLKSEAIKVVHDLTNTWEEDQNRASQTRLGDDKLCTHLLGIDTNNRMAGTPFHLVENWCHIPVHQ